MSIHRQVNVNKTTVFAFETEIGFSSHRLQKGSASSFDSYGVKRHYDFYRDKYGLKH